MLGRLTDHRNLNLAQLHKNVIRGQSKGKIIWQPRILCWYYDKTFTNEALPEPYTGMSLSQIYRELHCSNRIYEYNECFVRVDDHRVNKYTRQITELDTECVIETPVGKITQILSSNTSNCGRFPSKWYVTCEEDLKVATWMEERCDWKWDEAHYQKTYAEWGDNGLPTMYIPHINVQNLYTEMMGVEEAIYAICDYPDTVQNYFKSLDESHERLINVINNSKVDVINFGDNLHCGTLPPELFKKYVLPTYQKRSELLHKANKFIHPHWDGDTKLLLPFAKECGFDGIEAITPKPQGDVTLEEIKEGLGDELFLIDGIASVLFDDIYPEEQLIEQVEKLIELFAPKLILGISDEMSSRGNIERIKLVGKIVDNYNASLSE